MEKFIKKKTVQHTREFIGNGFLWTARCMNNTGVSDSFAVAQATSVLGLLNLGHIEKNTEKNSEVSQ